MKKFLNFILILSLLIWVISSVIISLVNIFDENQSNTEILNSITLIFFSIGYLIKNHQKINKESIKKYFKSSEKKPCGSCKKNS
jgi:c-di-AMP phosphodiesterase-like protein